MHKYNALAEPLPFNNTLVDNDPNNVVSATTNPIGRDTTYLLLLFSQPFIMALATIAAMRVYAWNNNPTTALTTWLLTYAIIGLLIWRWTFIVASGNLASRDEIRKRWRNESRKLDTAEEIQNRQLHNQAQRDQLLFQIEQAKIKRDREIEQLRLELATARHAERVALQALNTNTHQLIDNTTGEITTSGLVPAATNYVRQTIIDYFFGNEEPGVYGLDGLPNDAKIDLRSGKLHAGVPWSTRGELRSQEARKEAAQILRPIGQQPIVMFNKADKSWYLDLEQYPDAPALQAVLGRY